MAHRKVYLAVGRTNTRIYRFDPIDGDTRVVANVPPYEPGYTAMGAQYRGDDKEPLLLALLSAHRSRAPGSHRLIRGVSPTPRTCRAAGEVPCNMRSRRCVAYGESPITPADMARPAPCRQKTGVIS